MIFLRNSSPVIGDENMPNVPSVAPLWPSADVVAQQSVCSDNLTVSEPPAERSRAWRCAEIAARPTCPFYMPALLLIALKSQDLVS